LGFVAILPGSLLAQRKPKPPASYPGTAVFRCNIGDVGCGDGIIGDGSDYPGIGANETGSGAHLTGSNSELWLGQAEITIDFQGQQPTMCVAGSTCRWDWSTPAHTVDLIEVQSNVVDGPQGNEVTGGLLTIPVGENRWARFNMAITDDQGINYLLRFNSLDDPGSSAVKVTRTASCTWVFTDDGAQALLKSGVRRSLLKEGLFTLPFEMTFDAPGCTP
jgi:hypothetical protein